MTFNDGIGLLLGHMKESHATRAPSRLMLKSRRGPAPKITLLPIPKDAAYFFAGLAPTPRKPAELSTLMKNFSELLGRCERRSGD